MRELRFDPDRIEAMIKNHAADAWIVYSGSKQILEKFIQLSLPAFSLFGRMSGLPIAGSGTDIIAALRESIKQLHELGHRKIVMLTRSQLSESSFGLTEKTFIQELEKHHLQHSAYNLVGWDNTTRGLHECLERLFQVTPPTAIFVDEWTVYNAVQNFLLRKRGIDYRKVICISMDHHPSFSLYNPPAPHFYWDPVTVAQQAVRWISNISRGKHVVRQKLIEAEFRGRDLLTPIS